MSSSNLEHSESTEEHRPASEGQAMSPAGAKGAFDAQLVKRTWAAPLIKAGAVFIVLFQLAYFAENLVLRQAVIIRLIPFHLFAVITALATFLITKTRWFRDYWRPAIFCLCTSVVASQTCISVATAQAQPLFIGIFFLLIAAGCLMLWEIHWQGLLTAVCFLAMLTDSLLLPAKGINAANRWVGLLIGAGIALAVTEIRERFLADRERAERRLHRSLAKRGRRLRRLRRQLTTERERADCAEQAGSELARTVLGGLKSPAAAIIEAADVFAQTPLSSEQQRYLEGMKTSGSTLVDLINDIQDLALAQSGSLKLQTVPFDIRELVEKVAATLGMQAHAKRLELVARVTPEVPEVLLGDPVRVRQVLTNLLGNAIKFTRKGEAVLTVAPDVSGKAMSFTVSDTGIGMTGAEVSQVRTILNQGGAEPQKSSGDGIGLKVAARLAHLMGGRIEAQSELGKGTTVRFTAPLAPDTSHYRPSAERIRLATGTRALVIDDTEANRSLLTDLLSAQGAIVSAAESLAEAENWLEAASREGRQFDLVLLDSRMPSVDGAEAARRIRRRAAKPAILVLMLAADDLARMLPAMRKAGADGYIVKPLRRANLLEGITSAMAGVSGADSERDGSGARRALRILLVDGLPEAGLLVEAYLKGTGHHLDFADDPKAAREPAMGGKYDLVLVDWHDSGDCLEAVREIREWEREQESAPMLIVALVNAAFGHEVRESRKAGCDGYLTKPLRAEALLELLRDTAGECIQSLEGRDMAPRPGESPRRELN